MFSKSIIRLVAVLAFAFVANMGISQNFVDPETAIQRLDAAIIELEEDMTNSSSSTVSTGSLQAVSSAPLGDKVSLRLMKNLVRDVETLKSVDAALEIYREKAQQSPGQAEEMLNDAIDQVEVLLS